VTSVKISSKWCWWWYSLMALTKACFEIDKAWMLTQHYLIFRNSNMQSLHNKRELVRTAKLKFWLLQYWFSVGLEFGQYFTLSIKKILSDSFRCLNLRWNFLDGKKHHVQTSLLLSTCYYLIIRWIFSYQVQRFFMINQWGYSEDSCTLKV